MLVVLALGGNALLRRGEPLDLDVQMRNLRAAVLGGVAPIARRHRIVITHGNGPQIGLLALQAAAFKDARAQPLDVLGAESAGMIGYLIAQALGNELPGIEIATLLTRVEVDPADPAFGSPSKPIGPVYSEAEMRALRARTAWAFVPDAHGYRRAVPSPLPRRVIEINAVKELVGAGMAVICAGGGGVPVTADEMGRLAGVEAVIDKDHASALMAEALGADALLLLTDVPAVWTTWPMAQGRRIDRASTDELRAHAFDPGSMGPKVAAACRFADRTGRFVGIGAVDDAEAILQGRAGTVIARPAAPRIN